MKCVFVSDCEGPISKNDNAYEITAHFVPNGDKIFTTISKYDDILADILKKDNYSAGSTLKLILPFLKAYNITDKKIGEFSSQNIILIANSKETLSQIRKIARAFIVSTSYQHYLMPLCKTLDFPFANTYCTKLNLDQYPITEGEKVKLKKIAQEIAKVPMIKIPPNAKSMNEFSENDQETIEWLNEIFWEEIAEMQIGKVFSEVVTIGGAKKAEAIQEIEKRLNIGLNEFMYVGDSITDVEAFRIVKENEGLTVSFNGNEYAVKNAEIAVLCDSNLVTAIIASLFCHFGKIETLRILENWDRNLLRQSIKNPVLFQNFYNLYPKALPKVQIVTAQNMKSVARDSNEFRRNVRGIAVGRLG